MKRVLVMSIAMLLVASVVWASHNSQPFTTKVEFEGVFQEGTTLYSDSHHIVDGYFYGLDAYPLDGVECTIEEVEKRVRVCETVNYDAVQTCYLLDSEEQHCITKEQSRERTRRICHYETVIEERERCSRAKRACENPVNGRITNQLNLASFEYSFDGTNWDAVPYPQDKIFATNQDIEFRVNIPTVCKPDYDINNSVRIFDE